MFIFKITCLDLNNSTNNVRILYNAVRYRCTDKATIRYKPCCYFDVLHQQREHHPLPDDPRPQERGWRPHVHGAAPPGGKPQCGPVYSHEALILHLPRIKNLFRQLSHQLIPSQWQKSWSVNLLDPYLFFFILEIEQRNIFDQILSLFLLCQKCAL